MQGKIVKLLCIKTFHKPTFTPNKHVIEQRKIKLRAKEEICTCM